jgi:hypothetical protein
MVNHSWSFEILNFHEMYIFWIFKVLDFHIFKIVRVFLMHLIGYYHLICLTINLLLLYETFESPLEKCPFLVTKSFTFKST